jgi:phenylalanyl-tRNA synthetase beta chain
MRASYGWLKSLLAQGGGAGLEAGPEQIADELTSVGLEVEELIEYGGACRECVVAEVRGVEPHPERERLTLVTVDRGGAEQVVVCGAPNVPAVGRKVVLAPLGTHLPEVGLTVASRAIGGITSQGMLCSEQELGLVGGGGKGDGILVLPEDSDAALGARLSDAIPGTHDWVFEIGITPNRPDALGHHGLARDLAALYALRFEEPSADSPARVARDIQIGQLVSVEIRDTERCPHYGAAVLVDVVVGPSPNWLRYRLESLGIRAINNVVDVTNLILLEFGQPMHAFDLDDLSGDHSSGGRIVVRRATEGETIVTLDDVERKLCADDLVISDGVKPVALAGIMGAANTEISASSTRVLLECAHFTPRGVRRSSRRHALSSDSSYRFERGCDPEVLPDALAHAASLVTRLCGASAVPGSIMAGVAPARRTQITMRKSRMASLLGVVVSDPGAILTRLGCEVSLSEARPDEIDVVVPSFRPDLRIEADLIEEVMRIHGIAEVPTMLRQVLPKAGRSRTRVADQVRQLAAEIGLSETLCYSFVAPSDLAAVSAPPALVRLKNPLTEDRSVMRTSLLPGLCDAVSRAQRRGVADVRLFASGSVFAAPDSPSDELPKEHPMFAAVVAGYRRRALSRPEPIDVYDAKGVAEAIVSRVTGQPVEIRAFKTDHLHPRGSATLSVSGKEVGRFGPLHPDVADHFDIELPCVAVEIDIAALEGLGQQIARYRPIPVLPAVTRDLAFFAPEDVAAGELAREIQSAGGELCESVELFDRYVGKEVPQGQQSLAYHLVFRDPKAATDPAAASTLTDKQIDKLAESIVSMAKERYAASVRA